MSVLGNLLYNAFENCKENPSNEKFSNEITNAFETYFESGSGTTIDSGTVSSGYFVGSGTTTSLKGDSNSCKQIIYNTCEILEHNNENASYILSTAICNGLKILCLNSEVKCNVNGEVTQGSSTSTLSGTSKGNVSIETTNLVNDIFTIFNMFNVREDEDYQDYMERLVNITYIDLSQSFAYRIADKIKTCLNANTLNTQGEFVLLGDIGLGNIVFGE